MLKIHRPRVCLVGAIILVVSVVLYQEAIHQYNAMNTLYGEMSASNALQAFNRVAMGNRRFESNSYCIDYRLIGIYSGGIVVGVLKILYGLIPGRTKE